MKTRWGLPLVSFVLPIIILTVIYAAWGQYPFGEGSLLIWDMNWQYASFFSHLHDILHGNASALYSFSRAIGGNMFSVSAYYLMSPFNFLFYFFDAEHIYIGILIVTMLKTGAAGIAMYCFLSRKFQDGSAVIFSTAYALSAYMIAYQFNIFWLDALILVPFVTGGIERLVDEGRYFLYILSVSLAIITNFYMGYIVCLFSVLYFLCYFFSVQRRSRGFRIFLLYGISSLWSGVLSMWVVLPMLYILRRGKNGFSPDILGDFHRLFRYTELFDAGLCGTISNEQITYGKPLIYCGVFSVIMALYWIIRGKASVREKASYVILLLFIAVSFNHYNLNCIWHGFNYPVGSPYRFAFLYIFLLLDMAYKGYRCLMEQNDRYMGRTVIGIGVVLILGLTGRWRAFSEAGRVAMLFINLFLTAAYVVLLLAGRKKKAGVPIILALICLELFINAESLYHFNSQYDSIKVTEYREYIHNILPFAEQIKADDAFCRSVMTGAAARTPNDPFMFNLYGLDSYTSVEEERVIEIAQRFGYSGSMLWGIHYQDGVSQAANDFFGVKYMLSSENPGGGFLTVDENAGLALYENPNALQIAVWADESILDIEENLQMPDYINAIYSCLEDTTTGQQILVAMESDARFNITCTNESGEAKYMLCTIPWERGWRVRVDGERQPRPLDIQTFIAVKIEEGTHMIELEYVPQGLSAGVFISAIGAVLLGIAGNMKMPWRKEADDLLEKCGEIQMEYEEVR